MEDKELCQLEQEELVELLRKQQKENDRLKRDIINTKYELKICRIERRVLKGMVLKENWHGSKDLKKTVKPEIKPEPEKRKKLRTLRSTISILITVTAAAVLIAVLLMPVLRIYGTSMSPALKEGDFVVSVKKSRLDTGDVVAFYYNNNILVKRIIAGAGDWVDIGEDGTVYVNYQKLDEPYVTEKALGECNIKMPYQVPESRFFVMGDRRDESIDSRNTAVGCVAEEQIVGEIIFRIWPFSEFGVVR